MKKLTILVAISALVAGCGSQNEGPGSDPPEAEEQKPAPATPEAPPAEPACDEAAAEAQCVCPEDFKGEPPPCPHAAEGKPCGCENCPKECE